MANLIIHHNGAYNLYSTIVDSPVFESALTLQQLKVYIAEQEGVSGIMVFDQRLVRANKTGCSSYLYGLGPCIACNRAGPNESYLPFDEFIKQFLTLEK